MPGRQLRQMRFDQQASVENLQNGVGFQIAVPGICHHQPLFGVQHIDAGTVPNVDHPGGLQPAQGLAHGGRGDFERFRQLACGRQAVAGTKPASSNELDHAVCQLIREIGAVGAGGTRSWPGHRTPSNP